MKLNTWQHGGFLLASGAFDVIFESLLRCGVIVVRESEALVLRLTNASRKKLLGWTVALTVVIATADRISHHSLSFLYFLPIVVAAGSLTLAENIAVATTYSILREAIGPFAWELGSIFRIAGSAGAYFSVAFVVRELSRSRKLTALALRCAQQETERRQQAEESAKLIVESSPAAILMSDREGRTSLANEAAHRLLGYDRGELKGLRTAGVLPFLANIQRASGKETVLRTTVEATGKRKNGEVFLAQVWVSNVETRTGTCLLVIMQDASEQLRDREQLGLDRLLASSHTLVGAVSHELRNLSAAMRVALDNLGKIACVTEHPDYKSLVTLAGAMENISSAELFPYSAQGPGTLRVADVLRDLRIITESWLSEDGIKLVWEIPEDLPPVRADHQGLLQALLNLTRNSRFAVLACKRKEIMISSYALRERVLIRIEDSGPGVEHPEYLFRPFQSASGSCGLGLYISRSIVRAFGGDVRYLSHARHRHFLIELAATEVHVQESVDGSSQPSKGVHSYR